MLLHCSHYMHAIWPLALSVGADYVSIWDFSASKLYYLPYDDSLFVCRGWRLQHMGLLRLRTLLHAVRPFPGGHQLSAPGHLQPAGHTRWTARSGHLLAQLPQGSRPTCHAYRSVGYRSRAVFLGGGGVFGVIVHYSYSFVATFWTSLSSTFLQTLSELVTPLKGHSLSPRSCPPKLSSPFWRVWVLIRLWQQRSVQSHM